MSHRSYVDSFGVILLLVNIETVRREESNVSASTFLTGVGWGVNFLIADFCQSAFQQQSPRLNCYSEA